MKLSLIAEARWIEVTGGAQSGEPDYVWPWSHPHTVHQSPGGPWFHGTTDLKLESIKENGLSPEHSAGKPFCHITKQRSLAVFSAKRAVSRWGGNPIILTIDGDKLSQDLMGCKGDSKIESVPPEAITKVHYFKGK